MISCLKKCKNFYVKSFEDQNNLVEAFLEQNVKELNVKSFKILN